MKTIDTTLRIACLGGAYGNVAALSACLEEARKLQCQKIAFLGDAIGCCGHSDETLELLHRNVDVFVAGNHEQQAAAGSVVCGCNYSDPADEAIGCKAFELSLQTLGQKNRQWIATWPDDNRIETAQGSVFLCHGSPDQTNEFLFESELDDARLMAWLTKHDAQVMVCTHSGLPWVRNLPDGRVAVNCGVVGKPDHDGDTAVHFAVIQCNEAGRWQAKIQRVQYDAKAWTSQLRLEKVNEVLVSPMETGIWTSGVASLPAAERDRPQRLRHSASNGL